MQITEFDRARLWSKVNVPSTMAKFYTSETCWLWSGANVKGRGHIKIDGKYRYVPRVVWELFNGDPGDMFVCHTCDNPACVNPIHLFLGTAQDNMEDCVRKDRRGKKLTIEDVRQIRQDCKPNDPEFGYSALGRKYDVFPGTISRIVKRTRWKHVA